MIRGWRRALVFTWGARLPVAALRLSHKSMVLRTDAKDGTGFPLPHPIQFDGIDDFLAQIKAVELGMVRKGKGLYF